MKFTPNTNYLFTKKTTEKISFVANFGDTEVQTNDHLYFKKQALHFILVNFIIILSMLFKLLAMVVIC